MMSDSDSAEGPAEEPRNEIIQHGDRAAPFELSAGDDEIIERVSEHIESHIGPIETVFHEILSDLIHVDVYHVAPTPERPAHTLITSGMSERAMSPPEAASDCQFAELLVTLPADWPLSQEAFQDEANYWPVRALKMMARFPHVYESWLWWGHTVPNGNPPEPFHETVPFCCWLLAPPVSLPEDFFALTMDHGREVSFFSLVPLYEQEMNFKIEQGADALFDRFDLFGVNDLIDVERPPVVE